MPLQPILLLIYIARVRRLSGIQLLIIVFFACSILTLYSESVQMQSGESSAVTRVVLGKEQASSKSVKDSTKDLLATAVEKYTGLIGSLGDRFDNSYLTNYATNVNYMVHKALYDAPDALVSIRTLFGIPVDVLGGSIFDDYITPSGCAEAKIDIPKNFLINGLFGNPQAVERMRAVVACGIQVCPGEIFVLENASHYFGVGDIIKAIGQQGGAIGITALRAADILNASDGGNVIAHSNGATVFGMAMNYVRPEVRQKINYQGFGSQWHIDRRKYGLASARNTRDMCDPVPVISPPNRFQTWDRVIKERGDPFFSIDYHKFRRIYSPYLVKVDDTP